MEFKGSQQKRANQTTEATKAMRTAVNSLRKLKSWLAGVSISVRPMLRVKDLAAAAFDSHAGRGREVRGSPVVTTHLHVMILYL